MSARVAVETGFPVKKWPETDSRRPYCMNEKEPFLMPLYQRFKHDFFTV
jgi:hypothetical protein